MPHKPGTGAIFGIVSENGVAKENSPVYLMDMRRDIGSGQMKVISKQMTRPDGGFMFSGLDTEYVGYSVMASDEDGAEPKNALIQDRVQPVPVHLGSGIFGDWYTRIMKDGANAAIIPWPVQEQPLLPLALSSRVKYGGANLDATKILSVPEISGMAAIELITTARMCTIGHAPLSGLADFSIEFIFDFDSFGPTTTDLFIGSVMHTYSAGSSPKAIGTGTEARDTENGGFAYQITISKTKLMKFSLTQSAGSNTATLIETFDLSSLSGFKHVIVTYKATDRVNVYIQGDLFGTKITSVLPVSSGAFVSGIEIGGTQGTGFGANCIIGPIVTYSESLSASIAKEHFKALYSNNLIPMVTGYAAEICKETPIWYYRFNESYFDKGVFSELSKRNPTTGLPTSDKTLSFSDISQITHPVSSPFVGQSAFKKTAANTLSGGVSGLFGLPFRNQFSFTGWVYFENITPTSNETIIRFDSPYAYNRQTGGANPAPNGWFVLTRLTNKKIQLSLLIGSSFINSVFEYVASSSQWLNFWIVVDMRDISNLRAMLYIGTVDTQPVLVGTIPLPAGGLMSSASYQIDTSVPIGSGFNVQVAQNMECRLRDFAVLPCVTSLNRIVEIWESKDSP